MSILTITHDFVVHLEPLIHCQLCNYWSVLLVYTYYGGSIRAEGTSSSHWVSELRVVREWQESKYQPLGLNMPDVGNNDSCDSFFAVACWAYCTEGKKGEALAEMDLSRYWISVSFPVCGFIKGSTEILFYNIANFIEEMHSTLQYTVKCISLHCVYISVIHSWWKFLLTLFLII